MSYDDETMTEPEVTESDRDISYALGERVFGDNFETLVDEGDPAAIRLAQALALCESDASTLIKRANKLSEVLNELLEDDALANLPGVDEAARKLATELETLNDSESLLGLVAQALAAVRDVINAKSEKAERLAESRLRGQVEALREALELDREEPAEHREEPEEEQQP